MASFEEQLKKDWDKYISQPEIKFPNILIIGKSGIGKSSLINTIFGKDITKVSDTEPCTRGFKKYSGKKYNRNINIIDSEGYEISTNENESSFNIFDKKVYEYIKTQKDKNQKIHLVWFCISVASNRIEDMDISILKSLYSIPELDKNVCVILTKCDEDDGSTANTFKEIIRNQENDIFKHINIFEVSNDKNVNKDIEKESEENDDIKDINKLIEISADMIDDEEVKENFIREQKYNLKKKRESANKTIAAAAATAAAIGAVPIPFADSAVLVPTQTAMIFRITNIYNMDNIANISSGFVSNLIITQIGKTFASQLLKFIPFGSLINAGVASSITYALGYSISEICYDSCKKILGGENINMNNVFAPEKVEELFNQFMKKEEGK